MGVPSQPAPRPSWLEGLGRFVKRLGNALGPLVEAAGRAMLALDQLASIFRRSLELGRAGWALSTYGLLICPQAHAQAADLAAEDLEAAQQCLEDAWMSIAAQDDVAALLPYVYPPDQRELAN